ncbi:MAG: ubiquinone/menaquinone biosynthesis methyltransferase, partial [Sneathiella sp.]|nr:ubiquinone/menaquinone biosynthesis methyltransferase [Sneathiella sp.]
GRLSGLEWVNGDAMSLPLPDKSVDAYTIAFGIRNVTDIPMALREARRVLKPGGRFMCLEFSKVTMPGLKEFYDFYSFNLLPEIGKAVAGDRESYQYLVESIRKFPDADKFKSMIEEAGFGQVKYRTLSGGIAAIHSAWRI